MEKTVLIFNHGSSGPGRPQPRRLLQTHIRYGPKHQTIRSAFPKRKVSETKQSKLPHNRDSKSTSTTSTDGNGNKSFMRREPRSALQDQVRVRYPRAFSH